MLTPYQQQQLDEAYGHHSVHVFDIPQHTAVAIHVDGEPLPEQPITVEQQVWTYNFERRAWEYYGVPGSSMPTDYYVPHAMVEQRYNPTTGFMQVQEHGGLMGAIANGTTYTTTGTGIGDPIVVGNDFAYTYPDNTYITLNPIAAATTTARRGNNYDLVHKGTGR